jgi:hypothetical protein
METKEGDLGILALKNHEHPIRLGRGDEMQMLVRSGLVLQWSGLVCSGLLSVVVHGLIDSSMDECLL